MLSLVLILCVAGIVLLNNWHWKKYPLETVKRLIFFFKVVVIVLFVADYFILASLLSNYVDCNEQRIDALTANNSQIESLLVELEVELSDNPELLIQVSSLFEKEFNENQEELSNLHKNVETMPLLRWLFDFGITK